jgi:hypothetical protein
MHFSLSFLCLSSLFWSINPGQSAVHLKKGAFCFFLLKFCLGHYRWTKAEYLPATANYFSFAGMASYKYLALNVIKAAWREVKEAKLFIPIRKDDYDLEAMIKSSFNKKSRQEAGFHLF